MKYNKITPRMFLQGVGGTYLAIPFLESLLPSPTLMQNSIPKDSAAKYKRWDNNFTSQHGQGLFSLANSLSTAVSSSTHYANFANAAIALQRGSCTTLSTSSPSVECQKQLVRNIGLRFLRRPLSETSALNEVEDYRREFTGADAATAVGNLVFRFMLNPNFLLILENNETALGSPANVYKLSSYSIASRLSYTFWNTMPDEALLSLAQSSDLYVEANYQQALNLILNKQSAFEDSVQEFFHDWLRLDKVPDFAAANTPSFQVYAGNVIYNQAPRDEMIKEVQELGAYLASNGGKFEDIFTTQVSFVRNAEMMKRYGVSQAAPNPVTASNETLLPSGKHPGVFTRAALVASGTGAKNPVRRGLRLKEDVLCQTTPPPPSNLPSALEPPPFDINLTARERYAQKTASPSCMGCHNTINPLGFALSNYSGLGRYETTEPAFNQDGSFANRQLPVDARVDLTDIVGPGAMAENPLQFGTMISQNRQAKACFSQEFAKHFLSREPTSAEGCRLNKMYENISQAKTLKEFMKTLALDPDFRLRKTQ